MKPFLLAALALLFSLTIFAQVPEKAQELFKAGKMEEARKEIDDFLAVPKNAANSYAWYLKSKIYYALDPDGKLAARYPDSKWTSFLALKKYVDIDDKMHLALQAEGYLPINNLYTAFYSFAANNFNDKNYEQALNNFKRTLAVSDIMTEKKWISSTLDTNSVLYAGLSAEKLQKYDEAAGFYGKLITGKVKGEGFVEIYKWVANYYFDAGNMQKATQFAAIGKEVYPDNPFWSALDIDMARQTGNRENLFSMYEKTIVKEPGNHLYRYNYAVELYQYGYNLDANKRPANFETYIARAEKQIMEVVRIKPDYTRGQLFAGQIKYNYGVDLLNQLKNGTSNNSLSATQKDELKAKALKKFDEALPYFFATEKLLSSKTKLTLEEKNDLKEAYDLVITIYDQKGDQAKKSEYEKKFNEVDKKY